MFDGLKRFFKGTKYKINREILSQYMEESITFAIKEELSFCDEFFLMINESEKNKLHVCIINYDVDGDDMLESEKNLHGVIIFVNNKKAYNPVNDKKYYSIEEFINNELLRFTDEFILINELGAPTILERYKI